MKRRFEPVVEDKPVRIHPIVGQLVERSSC